MAISSAPIHLPKKHDVFISFRGEDTRDNFTCHLHNTFRRNQILSFIDNGIPRGDEISSTLDETIDGSLVSVVIFSPDYASSKYCLNELTRILHCRSNQNQIVIPVFYKVEPSDVRHQKGDFGQAFRKLEQCLKREDKHKMQIWKTALTQASNLAGWTSFKFRDDSELIQRIVEDVLEKLNRRYPATELRPVGVSYAETELLFKEFETIGLWGIGGIGKTTIAGALFHKYSSKFEGCCFLENVRENSSKCGGLHDLRRKLVCVLLEEENLHIRTNTMESTFVKHRLKCKKVLIVLDDINDIEQLEYLALDGETHCFGPGSRIIITTRDKNVLSKGVDKIYEVKPLTSEDSLQLFCLNAFNTNLPIMGYEGLSKSIVSRCKGLPLALKVLGSFLRDKSENEWDSTLRKLEKSPHEGVMKVLRISHDGLSRVEKEIFLDVACFFNGWSKDCVISVLDACGFSGAIGLRTLYDKALIIVDDHNNHVTMHDLILDVGREIIREKSIKEPGRRSRLWDAEEIHHVLHNNMGTERIEGIASDVSQIKEVWLKADAFRKMPHLRVLKFYGGDSYKRSSNIHLQEPLEFLPEKLIYLEWKEYPSKSLPSFFRPEKLVVLKIPNGLVEKLWTGVKDLVNLKELDLSGCEHLVELPDLSRAINLERLDATNCTSLSVIQPSIFSLPFLETLNLSGCTKLESLDSETHSRSLKYLNVDGCSNLKKFSVSSEELRRLDLRNTGIEILHPSIARSSKLEELYLGGLRLKNLPDEISSLRYLTELDLSHCEVVDNWKLHTLFAGLRSLQRLNLSHCCNITELPKNVVHLSRLESVDLSNCKKLHCSPKLPPQIRELDFSNCSSLVTAFIFMTCRNLMGADGRCFLFGNCLKLDKQSVQSIIEYAHSSMVQAAYGNQLEVAKYKYAREMKCEFCFPGSRIPGCFRYGTREGVSITMQLPPPSHLLGFVFSIVINHFSSKAKRPNSIHCRCYLGDLMVGETTLWYHKKFQEMNCDHIHVWYNSFDCGSILKGIGARSGSQQCLATFEFDGQGINVKECGVWPIFVSEFDKFVQQMEFKSKLEWGLAVNSKRPRDADEQEQQLLLSQLKKKIRLEFGICRDISALAAAFTRMNITRSPCIT